ncbi:MAG: L-threonine 3-O-phosphate decarboxylase [uncultured Frankineae bacterium]|uniref:Aminotransferase n=1 Tax=uncultured Frankineae bacterium TaxID=437475 RepID=A0A6J4KM30_9ACTN|nr:MAG: L-threonine 3-O-phosphate decarboxylase [uncultured Frankineae bacterium]
MPHDLRHHGDTEATPGLLDLAVNVRGTAPPDWLKGRLVRGLDQLGAYPDQRTAVHTVCRRHDRPADQVLLTAGAAEAFVLLARVLRPRHAVCVHPGFTEPEAALRAAGHDVHRLVLAPPYVLDPEQVPPEADLVVVGNPTNPTGVVHRRLAELCRPGRTVVVDEAFADAVPGEPQSLADRTDLPGLVVVRSLTKTWALAGLRVGYLLAPADLVTRLREAQPLWAVSSLSLLALDTCLARGPVAAASRVAAELAGHRLALERALTAVGVEVSPGSQAPYLLCRVPGRPDVREALRQRGIAVRRGDTFPGLTDEHWRTAVRGPAETERLVEALRSVLAG